MPWVLSRDHKENPIIANSEHHLIVMQIMLHVCMGDTTGLMFLCVRYCLNICSILPPRFGLIDIPNGALVIECLRHKRHF